MPNRSPDWLRQADRDFEQAVDSRDAGRHEWACVAAQQAAEKAVKALHLHFGQKTRGPIIARLLEELPRTVDVPELLVEKGRVLDNFYIPTRYPNLHSAGAPFDHYGSLQSDMAIRCASEVIEFVRTQIAEYTNRLDFRHGLRIAATPLC